jgi:hypothetical protein
MGTSVARRARVAYASAPQREQLEASERDPVYGMSVAADTSHTRLHAGRVAL